MADFNSYGDPTLGAMTQPLPVNAGADVEQLRMGWLEALQNPAVRSGLLQFGLQAMQPVPVQQTGPGAMGQAIGAGVEAYNRNIVEQNRVAQGNQENAFKSEELGLKRESIDVQREGNRQQYDVGLKGIEGRTASAALATRNRLIAAQIAAVTRADVSTQSLMAEWAATETLYGREATTEAGLDFLKTINVGKGPTLPVTGTEGTTPPTSVPGADAGGIPSFASEALANEAGTAGTIKPGQSIVIDGVRGKWYP